MADQSNSPPVGISPLDNFYKTILETSIDILYKADLQTLQFEYMTPSMLTLTGYTPEECYSMGLRGISDRIHPDDRAAHWDHFQRLTSFYDKLPVSSHIEFRLARKDGVYRWFSDRHTISQGENGLVLFANVRDVTERKEEEQELWNHRRRLEEQVRERTEKLQTANQRLQQEIILRKQVEKQIRLSEKRYRSLFNDIPVGIFRTSPSGEILDANPALIAMFDFPDKKTYLAMNARDHYVDPQDRDRWQSLLQTRDTVQGVETRLKKWKGGTLWARINIQRIRDEFGREWYEGTIENISQRKEMELRLEEERNLLRTIIDAIPHPIYVKDRQSRFVLCNQKIIQTTQSGSMEEMIGKSDFDFLPPDLARFFYEREQILFQTGQPMINAEEVGFDEKGRELRVLSSKVPLYDSRNQIIGLVGIAWNITELKKAEEKLALERNLLRTIIDAIPDHIYVKDLQSRFLLCNQYLANHVNARTPEDMIGKSDFDYIRRELAEQYFAEEQNIFRTGEPIINKEEIGRDQNHQDVWVLSTKVPLRNSSGEVIGLVGIGRDITLRKRMTQALQDSEQRFRHLSESAFEGVVVHKNGRIIHANSRYYQMLGFTPEELQNVNVVEKTIHPEDIPVVMDHILSGEESPYEIRAMRKDGTVFPLEVHGRPAVYAGQPVRISAIRDITWRKEAEEKLRFQAMLIDQIQDFIGVVDPKGNLTFVNQAVKALFDASGENLVGKNLQFLKESNFFNQDPWIPFYHALEYGSWQGEMVYLLPEREPIVTDFRSWLIRNEKDQITGVCSIATNITERKKIEEELDLYRSRIAQVEQIHQLSMVSATMAHELNQPLSVIRLLLQDSLLEWQTSPQSDRIRENLNDCLEEIESSITITQRYRSATRLPLQGRLGNLSIAHIADRIIASLRPAAEHAKIRLETHLLEELPSLEGHSGDIEQIFFTLIHNAIQAADRKIPHSLRIEGQFQKGTIRIAFRDDCGGIRPEHLEHIFEPFFTTKSLEQGTGLGLSIVKRILQGYGGNIKVQNHWPQGVTFILELPLRQ